MDNLPTSTKLDLLAEKEIICLELKYKGMKYEEIAKEIGTSVGNIKYWFGKEGKLLEPYQDFTREQNDMRREEARHIIRQNINKAASVLSESLLSKDEKIKLKASIEMLNRELGQPRQEIDLGRTSEELDLLREIIADGKSKQPVQDRRETDKLIS